MVKRTYYSDNARQRANIQRSMVAAICIVIGIAIGTVIALLFAPEDGESLRHTIAEKADEVRDKAERKVKEIAS